MKSQEHFLNILLSLPNVFSKGSVIPITVEELAVILFCTPRNVKLILRKLIDEGFIEWKAGVGRGNASQMTLLQDLNEVVKDYFQDTLAKGKMKEAIELVNRKDLPAPVRSKLQLLLESQFGLHVEQTNSVRLDVLRVPRSRTISTIDPAFVATSAEAFFLEQICNTLITFDAKKNRFRPSLAHTWESNKEGTRWTFYLRKGVRFHHGRVLTSKDVLYTLDRLRDINSPSIWQYEDVARVEMVNDITVTFHLKQPNLFFPHFISCIYMSILPHDVTFSEKEIIGTGPFRIAQFTDQVLVLEAFEHHFGGRPLLDRVEIWQIGGDYSRRSRQYDLPYVDHQDDDGEAEDLTYEEIGCRYLLFNFRINGIQHDPGFRQAIRLLYDSVSQIAELGNGRVAPASSFLPGKSKLNTYTSATLEEARLALQRSGYAGETIKLFHNANLMGTADADWLQRRAEQIGLRLSLHALNLADYYSTEADQEANMVLLGEVLEEDVEWGLLRLFKDDATFIHRLLNKDQLAVMDAILADFVTLPTVEARSKCIDRVEQTLREQNWLIYGYHAHHEARFHPSLRGLTFDSFGWIDFSKLWIKPSSTI